MKKYIKPNLTIIEFLLTDIICTSVENFSSYIAEPGDWGEDPTFDPDDEIDW